MAPTSEMSPEDQLVSGPGRQLSSVLAHEPLSWGRSTWQALIQAPEMGPGWALGLPSPCGQESPPRAMPSLVLLCDAHNKQLPAQAGFAASVLPPHTTG